MNADNIYFGVSDDRESVDTDLFDKHLYHMTSENLRSKAAIAIELAYRDQQIAELTKQRDELKQEMLTIKRMSNTCSDDVESLELTMHQICTIANDALSTQGANSE